MAPISIGEIHVPGGAGQASARCLTLTSPLQQERGLELFFAVFAADAPKRVVEKLCDRLGEELRTVFFQAGEPEARFEAALKQANKSILAFLYEHGLSLPGIKLRGAAAALADGKLYVSSRGAMRGLLYLPQSEGLAPYALFGETLEKPGEPKFFTSLHAGTFPDGARLVMATSELFQTLDEAYVRDALSQSDFAKASRDVKQALKHASKTVSILSLTSVLPVGQAAGAAVAKSLRPARPPNEMLAPDVGEWSARGLRAAFLFLGRAAKALALLVWSALKLIVLLPVRLPRLIAALASREKRSSFLQACKNAPGRCLMAATGSLNAVPEQSRVQFFLLLAVGAVFAHGLLFSIRHEVRAQSMKAYQAQLAELQQLEADFDTGMIYDNENRSRELIARMETVWSGLPEETEAQQKTKTDARAGIERSKEKMSRIATIAAPAAFGRLNDGADVSALAWFEDKLFAFSGFSGQVRVLSTEGAAVADPVIAQLPDGVAAVAPARTGFILRGMSGKIVYWNPDTSEETAYDAAGIEKSPILFYQGRLYAAAADGSVTRRSVAASSLGSPADVLRGAPASPTAIATDGAVYLLYKDGSTKKYMKGAVVQDYAPSQIEPAPADAAQLWASAESDKIVFIDRGGDRAYAVDRTNGRLLAQYVSPAFKNLRAAAVDEHGRTLTLLTGDGSLYQIPLK